MADVITGQELKVRGFEAQDATVLASDHKFNVDGPSTGPRSAFPKVVAEGVLPALTRVASIGPLQQPHLPVVHGSTGQAAQTILAPLSELLSGSGSLYLGPFSFPPATDNQGNPLRVGSTYYNTQSQEMFVWSSAGKWVPQNQASPGALRAYYYFPGADTTVIPQGGPGQPDARGNFLDFDITGGSGGRDPVNVFVNGVLQVNGVDYTLNEGSATGGDYILLSHGVCGGSCVVVQVHGKPDVNFVVSSVAIATNTWVKNGATKTFPLVDQGGSEVFPQAAVNCLTVNNGRTLHPNVEFTINGSDVTFLEAPFDGDDLWMTVGLPTLGVNTVLEARISPYTYGGVGDGVADDTNAVKLAIQNVNEGGGRLELASGTWRITSALPTLTQPRVNGGGTGELYVDYNPNGAVVLNCVVATVASYAVNSVTVGVFDFAGAFSPDTEVTIIDITLEPGQSPPQVGQIGKLTALDQIIGAEEDDFAGQHVYIAAAVETSEDEWTLYVPSLLVDTYATSMQLDILGSTAVLLEDFKVRGNWARVVAEDWRGTMIRVSGAIAPRMLGLSFEDGLQGLLLAGTYRASSIATFARRMRNATASETPPVTGYGVIDAGSCMSVHTNLSGDDCRHLYTTLSLNSDSNTRINWGRAYRPLINGGSAGNCSSSAYDTHPDAYEAQFSNLEVDGGYFSEQSTGSGFQFRGVRCKASNCHVKRVKQGFVFYKQIAGEAAGHLIDGCSYEGVGPGLRASRDDDLTSVEGRQTGRVKDFTCIVSGATAIDLEDTDLDIEGIVKVIHVGSVTGARAVFLRVASVLRGADGGRLVYDFSRMTGTPNPRVITYETADSGAQLNIEVIAGSIDWQAWVSDNEMSGGAPAGTWLIEGNSDIAPQNPSGGYSEFGANNRLTPGSLKLRSTVRNARQGTTKSSNFALFNCDHRQVFVCTAAITITIGGPDIVGYDFSCTVIATSGTVTLDGPGGTNGSIPAGSRGLVTVANGRVYVNVATVVDMS